MKYTLVLFILFAQFIYAKEYKGCALTRENAVTNLSKNILVTVQSNTNISKVTNANQYDKTVIIKNTQESNVELTNITITQDGKQYCASINSSEQTKFLKKLKKEILLYDLKQLPQDIPSKIAMLDLWYPKITRFLTLYSVFDVSLTNEEIIKLKQLQKTIADEKLKLVIHQNNKIWKGCGENKLDSLIALDKKVFSKVVKTEDKGLFDSLTSIFSSTKQSDLKINLFNNFIQTQSENKQICSFIEKEKILYETKRLFTNKEVFVKENLPLNPKEQIKTIDYWLHEVGIINILMPLFPNHFTTPKQNEITALKNNLEKLKTTIDPQFVKFIITDNTQDVEVKLNKKQNLKPNEELYLKAGTHNYTAIAKDRCPITDKFELSYLEDKEVELSFEESNYPTILFNSNKFDAQLSVDGKIYKVAKKYTIPTCDAEVPYIITFGTQSYHGTLKLQKNENIVKQFDFLSPLEIKTFNDTKAKNFKVDMNKELQANLSNEELLSSLLKFSVSSSPSNGSINLDERGSFIYTPNKNYRGDDSFKYKVSTASDESPEKLVHITVVGVNRAPKAITESINIKENENYSGTLKATDLDEDKLTFKLISTSKNATVVIQEDGDFTYKPNKNFSGIDKFTYQVSDPFKGSDSKTVIVNVQKDNIAPTVKEFEVQTTQNIPKEFKLLASDKDGDTLVFKIMKDVQNGSLKCDKDLCKYTPIETFVGEDSFSYQVSDGIAQSDTITIKITVTATTEKLQIEKKNLEMSEEDYKEFKSYLEALFESNDEKTLFQLKEKYPNTFNRFLQEKMAE